jgi:hypothetical protein
VPDAGLELPTTDARIVIPLSSLRSHLAFKGGRRDPVVFNLLAPENRT